MENLYENGYIFQRATSSIYQGIDGDNWYLNYCSDNTYFAKFHEDTIDNGIGNPESVECCIDVDYMRRCVEESKKNLEFLFEFFCVSQIGRNLFCVSPDWDKQEAYWALMLLIPAEATIPAF